MISLGNLVTLQRQTVPTEVTHTNIAANHRLDDGRLRRDLVHISDNVAKAIDEFGEKLRRVVQPYDPTSSRKVPLGGDQIMLAAIDPDAGHVRPGGRPVLATTLMYFLISQADEHGRDDTTGYRSTNTRAIDECSRSPRQARPRPSRSRATDRSNRTTLGLTRGGAAWFQPREKDVTEPRQCARSIMQRQLVRKNLMERFLRFR